jgi:uncharacterized protein DUF2514
MIARILGWFTGSLGAYIAAGLLVAGVSAWGVQTWRLHSAQTDLATKEASWATERARAIEAAASAAAAYRAKEQAWAKTHEEIINAAIQKTQAAASAVVAADTAARSLQQRVAALAAASRRATCHPAAAGSGQAASDPADLLAYMQRRIDEASGRIGSYADSARIAGEACVSAYETLRK